MRLADAGERRLVERLRDTLGVAGPEDDVAELADGPGRLVASTDLCLASRHFPDAMTDAQRGRYAVAVNLSDLAAAGAEPVGMLLAFGLPPDLDDGRLDRMAQGARELADRFDCPIVGGDTKPAEELTLAGTAVGRTDDPMPRASAAPGETLCVTGRLGGAGRAQRRWQAGESGAGLSPFLEPFPRIPEGRALAEAGASACMDLSDGLAYSLHRIAEVADVGFEMDADAVPVADGATRDDALFGAGDFELVCTVPDDRVDEAASAVAEAGGSLARVGRVVEEGVEADGEPLPDRGFEHFGPPDRPDL